MTPQNPLRNAIVVTLTWWLVFNFLWLLTWQGDHFDDYFDRAVFLHAFAASFSIVGGAAAVAFYFLRRYRQEKELRAGSHYGLTYTIGPVPQGLGEPPRARGARIDWSTATGEHLALREWYESVTDSHPEIARAFDAVVEVHMAKAHWPAGKTSLGHGGRTLLDHAFRVAAHILSVAQTFEYVGTLRRNGSVLVPPVDKAYHFDKNDPLLGLVGFCHDIGKLETLKPEPLGKITEIRHDHDRVGALMLARIEEFFQLGLETRSVVLDSVSFYHRPSDMPLNVSDRARALMQLLRTVDIESSKWEFVHPVEADGVQIEDGKTAFDRRAVDKVCDILGLPNRINGPKGQTVGYKYQEFVYLHADSLASVMAAEFGNDTLAAEAGHTPSGILSMVMGSLAGAGLLVCDWMGATAKPEKAYFVVDWFDHRSLEKDNPKYNSPALERWPLTVILRAELVSPGVARMGDCRLIPRIEQPAIGFQRGVATNPLRQANSAGYKGRRSSVAESTEESEPEGADDEAEERPEKAASAVIQSLALPPEAPASEVVAHGDPEVSEVMKVESVLSGGIDPGVPFKPAASPSARVLAAAARGHEDRKPKRAEKPRKAAPRQADGAGTAEAMVSQATSYFDEHRISLARVPGQGNEPWFVAPINDHMERHLAGPLRTLRAFGNQDEIRIAANEAGQTFLAIRATPSRSQLELLVESEVAEEGQ